VDAESLKAAIGRHVQCEEVLEAWAAAWADQAAEHGYQVPLEEQRWVVRWLVSLELHGVQGPSFGDLAWPPFAAETPCGRLDRWVAEWVAKLEARGYAVPEEEARWVGNWLVVVNVLGATEPQKGWPCWPPKEA